MDLKALQKEAHATAKDHGWWDEERTFGDCIALVHSELSEALEAYRDIGLATTNPVRKTGLGDVLYERHLHECDGNYWFSLSQRGTRKVWRKGAVEGFARKRLGAWYLLYRVLQEALGDRGKAL